MPHLGRAGGLTFVEMCRTGTNFKLKRPEACSTSPPAQESAHSRAHAQQHVHAPHASRHAHTCTYVRTRTRTYARNYTQRALARSQPSLAFCELCQCPSHIKNSQGQGTRTCHHALAASTRSTGSAKSVNSTPRSASMARRAHSTASDTSPTSTMWGIRKRSSTWVQAVWGRKRPVQVGLQSFRA